MRAPRDRLCTSFPSKHPRQRFGQPATGARHGAPLDAPDTPPPATPVSLSPPGCSCPNCHCARRLRAAGAAVEVLTAADIAAAAAAVPSPEALGEDGLDPEQREAMRRRRISEANRGRQPWNKGVRHSEETRAKIRERTVQAMQNPDLRKRLSQAALLHRHTPETREKIRLAAHRRAERRRCELFMLFAAALAWARAARHERSLPGGSWVGRPTLLLPERCAGLAPAPPARADARPKRPAPAVPSVFSGRQAKSPEHRAKISAAIRAKWRQPVRGNKKLSSDLFPRCFSARAAALTRTARAPRLHRRSTPRSSSGSRGRASARRRGRGP